MKKRPKNKYAKDLRMPQYKMRVVVDKKKKAKKKKFKPEEWKFVLGEPITDLSISIVEGDFFD